MNERKPAKQAKEHRREAGSGGGGESGMRADNWRETLRDCVVLEVLCKAVLADLRELTDRPLNLSYRVLLEELSRWAERRHHELRRRLREQGCFLLNSKRFDHCYRVELLYGGYQQEALFSVELVKAECQQQMRMWLTEAQADNR